MRCLWLPQVLEELLQLFGVLRFFNNGVVYKLGKRHQMQCCLRLSSVRKAQGFFQLPPYFFYIVLAGYFGQSFKLFSQQSSTLEASILEAP